MRGFKPLCVVAGLFALVSVPGSVRAEDDNVWDGKSYPGAMCSGFWNTTSFSKPGGTYTNGSVSAIAVCPIIQDSWVSTAGLTYGRINVDNGASGGANCTQTAYDVYGNFVSSLSATDAIPGKRTLYFASGGSYLPATATEGSIVIQCALTAGTKILSYQVQEKA